MSDIAREAGVSLSTVSYALSGKRPISPATRERIQEAIDRLSYHPTASARALALNRSSLLAVAAPLRPGANGHVIMQFVRSMLGTAYERDVDILLVAGEDAEHTQRVIEEGKADALVVMDLSDGDPRTGFLRKLPKPVVLIGYPKRTYGLACVDFDFREAAALCVRELHGSGSRSIWMIRTPQEAGEPVFTYQRRSLEGFHDGLDDFGLTGQVVELPAAYPEVLQWARQSLLGPKAPDALFVHHEALLAPLGRALRDLGVEVPNALQVAAIAPQDVATDGPWQVSGTTLPIETIGATAVTMALDLVDDTDLAPSSQLLAPRFTHRETTR
ncbi:MULTISPECIES: LacI family DNA-binding transcriptional regulator [unclassified Actinomyces]|uniref:LacI family DNA-binding transcriptional regulator n=1 Tax=unclassified Actinomyces TaxID=2609248 RepID=UPI002017DD26|nr:MULTISPECIES: LacI family DNA-binding transcriptional regulator [unclassified Actinomyces]MCL3778228.1 LacI family DNA-binding transcriptional regulator [Actinomyces sp. AC-20-1]MCL3789131.1 LacI family DNA-binding transcriptional regulator [Actinomyces sp. 187325]MCL3791486.1 LacI family DNA-binding transcriptional regulator [Actinomyces sp. 186855]MCL3794076.1 LacI family DNA-binding transcriptional regulator [Actinomyces sp. 217892]